jgi:hypothetical protein
LFDFRHFLLTLASLGVFLHSFPPDFGPIAESLDVGPQLVNLSLNLVQKLPFGFNCFVHGFDMFLKPFDLFLLLSFLMIFFFYLLKIEVQTLLILFPVEVVYLHSGIEFLPLHLDALHLK